MSIRVVEYIRADTSNLYQRWFDSLDRNAATKVAMARSRLELGHTSAIKWFGGIGEYRGESLIVLFGGGTKQGQRADIAQARALYDEYKASQKTVKRPPRRRQ